MIGNQILNEIAYNIYQKIKADGKLDTLIVPDGLWEDNVMSDFYSGWYALVRADGEVYGHCLHLKKRILDITQIKAIEIAYTIKPQFMRIFREKDWGYLRDDKKFRELTL